MKRKFFISLILCASWLPLSAQNSNEVEQLRLQLQQVKDAFDKAQAEHRRQIDELTRKLDDVLKRQNLAPTSAPAPSALEQQIAAQLGASTSSNTAVAPLPPPTQSWSASQPIPVFRAGPGYMNVSFDAMVNAGWSTASKPADELQLGDHDPISRGFSLRNAEIALDGAVDPYFKGFANLLFKLDNDGETELELEEVYAQSTSLPANLQLKAGQFFAPFGRQNTQHPHQWAFVDQPLISTRVLGPDGLRNVGAQLSWLAPLPFFTEATLGVFNGEGETAMSFRNPGEDDGTGVNRYLGRATRDRNLRGIGDLLYVPRVSVSFDVTEEQTILAGVSGAFAPNNTGAHTRTEVYGLDFHWKWKPANAVNGFPFVAWQTELMQRNFEAGADSSVSLARETIRDYGLYSQIQWGFRPRWIAAMRGEWVTGNNTAVDEVDVFRGDRTRLSPALTWLPTEFSRIRLQYNYDQGQHFADQHSIWMQLEFLLGAHGAHQY